MSARTLLDYHERTKHSYESIRREGGGLDWSNEPSPFKEYLDLAGVPLPRPTATGVSAHEAIARSATGSGEATPTLEILSHVLYHAAGVSRIVRGSFGEIRFRTYASAGALYPNELYVVCGDVEGLGAGVYHYGARDHDLTLVRDGDARGSLGLEDASPGSASVVLTGVPWRTAWKYGSRGFRHLYWDAGMIVANLLCAAAANGLPARVLLGFVDASVARVIGVDGVTEFPLCAIALGEGGAGPSADLPAVDHRVAPVSRRPRRDPTIEKARDASTLRTEHEVRRFRAGRRTDDEGRSGGVTTVPPLGRDRLSRDGFERVVRRRGSSRAFAREAVPAGELAALADAALGGISSDWTDGAVRASLVASALEGLAPGAYRHVAHGSFLAVREGDLRRKTGFVCLEQRLGADAAAAVFLMVDLEQELDALGPRGYAASQLEAAIVAGRLYLGAYAQCVGASGITFYDDEVRRLVETSAEPMLAVVIGPEGQRGSLMRCRERLAPG